MPKGFALVGGLSTSSALLLAAAGRAAAEDGARVLKEDARLIIHDESPQYRTMSRDKFADEILPASEHKAQKLNRAQRRKREHNKRRRES